MEYFLIIVALVNMWLGVIWSLKTIANAIVKFYFFASALTAVFFVLQIFGYIVKV